MKNILILGSGQSSPELIEYLAREASSHDWQIRIADKEPAYTGSLPSERTLYTVLDAFDPEARDELIAKSDLVLSMLPARFHPLVLENCLKHKKDLITPSYESKEMQAVQPEIDKAGILVLNEMGLDPGIDHMSAMETIDELREQGCKITVFESFAGGLMAPGYDQNAWRYKFTWNPRNVVLAGQGAAVRFLHNGMYKYIPYTRIFRRTEKIEIEGYGSFEGYANRDSLCYIDKYDLHDIKTIFRGALRRPGFCRAWDVFVQLGATDDSYIMEGSETMTCRQFINSFLPYNPTDSIELKLMYYLNIDRDSGLMEKLHDLRIFSDEVIGLKNATPAQILEHILKKSWSREPGDKDMIVMWHKFYYQNPKNEYYQQRKSLAVIGKDREHTAMAITVGLPMGMAAKLFLTGKITLKGLHIPVKREIYQPVLRELALHGIAFTSKIYKRKSQCDDQPVF